MKLLRLEYRKLIPYKVFWFFTLVYFVLLPILLASFHRFEIRIRRGTTLGFDFYYFPDVWHNISYMMSWFNVVLYFFLIVLVTNEYQYRTLRQHVIDGLSRGAVLWGKLQLIFLLTLVSTLFISGVAFGCGYLMTDSYDPATAYQKTGFLVGLGLQTLGYLLFVLNLSFLLKKQGFTIIFFVLYMTVLENILNYKVLPETWGQYLPLKVFGQLVPNPFPAYFGQEVAQSPPVDMLWISGGYILALILWAYGILKRQNL